METSERISPKQSKLLAFILTERTLDEACKKAGVTFGTYRRWMAEPDFVRELRNVQTSVLENTVSALQGLNSEAVETLRRNLNCGNPSVEIRTATIILEQSLKGMEMLGLKDRVEELEAIIEESEVDTPALEE